MSVSFESKIDIDISQSPPTLAKFDTATLSANISYNGNSQELSAYGSEITYQWLYSSDGGKTYRSIPSDNAVLSVAVDSKNLNYIYKLQLSVLNPSYKLQSNISNAVFVDSEGNALTTNQYGTPDIVVWYSKDVAVNHAINNSILAPIVDEEIEKNIVSVDLITEDGELLSETPAETADDLEYSSDNIRENTDIIAMPTLPVLSYGAVSSGSIVQQQNYNSIEQLSSVIDCYKPMSKTVCGVTFNMCQKEIRERTWGDWFNWPPGDCVSIAQCKPECTFGASTVRIQHHVGTWFNVTIDGGREYKWCDFLGASIPMGKVYDGTLDRKGVTNAKEAILCSNSWGKYNIAVIKNKGCGGRGSPCPGFSATEKNGTLTSVDPVISWYYELTPNEGSAKPPCYGPVTVSYSTFYTPSIPPKEIYWSVNPTYSCNDEVYLQKSYCECDNEKIYGGTCTEPIECQPIGPPTLSYTSEEGLSVTATVEIDKNGKETKNLTVNTTVDITGKGLGGKTITFKLDYATSNNYQAPKQFQVSLPNIDTKAECDVYQVTMSKDAWGDCIASVGPCAVGIPDGRKCYEGGDKYYSWNSIGTATVTDAECRADCNKAATNPPANVAILGIKPEQSRPVDPSDLLSLSEAEAIIAEAYKDKPYYIQKYKLRNKSSGINPCYYSCKDKQGNWKQNSLAQDVIKEVVADGNKIPHNLCEACGCKQNKDCNGCEVCVAGNCVPPFSPGHPCQDPVNETCCIGYDTDTFDKVVSCANTRKCETCQTSYPTNGETAQPTYKTQLKQGCCNGIIYDTQCQKCENDTTVVAKCIAPEKCVYISEETVVIDYEQYTYSKYECKIPPCPPCQREALDYNSTGNCINYSDTIEAKSTCKQCEVVTDSNGQPAESITSTLIPGQTCCETIPGTEWTPAWVCCKDSTPYYVCSQGASCCGGECSDGNYCCVGGQKIPKDPCIGCDGEPYCPAGQICCYRSWDKAKGCASPSDCEECNTGFGAFGPVVRKVAALRQNPPDPCKECQNGEVVTITSEDPDSPCYDSSEPQSIFFVP